MDPLREAIRFGRFYEVADWVKQGNPLQFHIDRRKPGRAHTPLQIAVAEGQYDMVRLLLCNGYDLTLEWKSPLNVALDSRYLPLVHLLLDWGADPHGAYTFRIYDSYDRETIERFWRAGVDFTQDEELAAAVSSGSNKPLYGFVKHAQREDPGIRHELNRGLIKAVEDDSERGIALCLWAGADPHAEVFRFPLGQVDPDCEDELKQSAIQAALWSNKPDFLTLVGVDPARDDVADIVKFCIDGRCARILAEAGVPIDLERCRVRRTPSLGGL